MGKNKSWRITLALTFLFSLLVILFSLNSVTRAYASEETTGWSNIVVHMDWSARLKITVLTKDGAPLEKAWVYIVDVYTGGNVTAALTDSNGNAGTLFVDQGNSTEPLKIEPGDRVDIGFNLLRGWYWLDENMMLTGEPVNPDWNPVSKNDPPQPLGSGCVQYVSFNGSSGWARFFGKYTVVVYYKPGGCSSEGPVGAQVVFNSFTDEPQHRYIYLGILPEDSSSDYSASQARIVTVNVGDMVLVFKDAEGRPLENVHVLIEKWGISSFTGGSGRLLVEQIPLSPGTSYMLTAEWTSRYGSKIVLRTSATANSEIIMPVYDATLEFLTPGGRPMGGVDVTLGGAYLGKTDGNGRILATRVPLGGYEASARWFGADLVLQTLDVMTSGEVTLTPANVHSLRVMVRGAAGQALEGVSVVISKNGFEVVRTITDRGGNIDVELPDGDYAIDVSFDSFAEKTQVSLTNDDWVRVDLDVFAKLFGVGITLSQFLLLILAIAIVIIAITIILHEYHIYRRKKLPQLFASRKESKGLNS